MTEMKVTVTDQAGNEYLVYPKQITCKLSEGSAIEITLTFDNPDGTNTNIVHFKDDIEIEDAR